MQSTSKSIPTLQCFRKSLVYETIPPPRRRRIEEIISKLFTTGHKIYPMEIQTRRSYTSRPDFLLISFTEEKPKLRITENKIRIAIGRQVFNFLHPEEVCVAIQNGEEIGITLEKIDVCIQPKNMKWKTIISELEENGLVATRSTKHAFRHDNRDIEMIKGMKTTPFPVEALDGTLNPNLMPIKEYLIELYNTI